MKDSTNPEVSTANRFRAFAEVEARGLSDCYEEWATGVATDGAVLELIDRLPGPKRQPNLVFSASRYLGAPVTGYAEFARWLATNWGDVEDACRARATQTNEPARCATLLPALAGIPGPLALIEVGASAGLCLYPDRYSYRYQLPGAVDAVTLHPEAGPSTVQLDCDLTGPVPVPDRLPDVVWRAGIDLNPLDVGRAEDLAWLDALIWPEHHERRKRLRAAAELAKSDPVDLVRGDLVAELEALVGRAPGNASVVVFHTAVLAYLDADARLAFVDLVDRLPVTWLANEAVGVVPGVAERLEAGRSSPGATSDFVLALGGEPVAFTQPHGRALHWLD